MPGGMRVGALGRVMGTPGPAGGRPYCTCWPGCGGWTGGGPAGGPTGERAADANSAVSADEAALGRGVARESACTACAGAAGAGRLRCVCSCAVRQPLVHRWPHAQKPWPVYGIAGLSVLAWPGASAWRRWSRPVEEAEVGRESRSGRRRGGSGRRERESWRGRLERLEERVSRERDRERELLGGAARELDDWELLERELLERECRRGSSLSGARRGSVGI